MASFLARTVCAVLRMTGTYRKRFSGDPALAHYIEATRTSPDLPTASMKAKLRVEQQQVNGRSVWTLSPKDGQPTAHLLFFHGGGYVYPAVDAHWKFYAYLASKYGLSITAPLYPLAPESDALETTAWAMGAYRHFLNGHDGKFIMGGDSAGAGLASVVAQQARDEGLRQADGLLLICPWLDATGSHPDQAKIEPRDCILTLNGLHAAAELYAGDLPLTDPRLSPIHGDWSGLPPILAFGGGDDILVVDARALARKVPSSEYVEEAGLMHDWPIFFLSESRKAQARIAEFAKRYAAPRAAT